MTTPPQPQSTTSAPPAIPAGIRIASTLCWIVGVLTILVALALGIPAISSGAGLLFIAVNGAAGALACLAGIQIRRQRKIGVLLMVLAWAVPTLVAVLKHLSPSGSLLLFVALLLAGANWKHFR
jgi:hypothetical protein